ncbi:acyl-CoA dehydrogenase family protein [Advenella mimigardefordensis]|uniref:Putative acyl-CoA dehydrogenase n=1 Tax=Advenella mimigardefordensis (strain DSM 17166 / LMG 22922 / DPN7) TaxID=1247726 RepID=W0PIK4_ADVMD|nr:acyl-CoA dehydrogenase family protein [Advenella mimigardefordensis]AHG65280.1 putative acyl-CoA dehydrogenase [Advenella mimigardefordensis DPN7]
MSDHEFLDWPFFTEQHRHLAVELDRWAQEHLRNLPAGDTDDICRELVRRMGEGGWLRYAVPAGPKGSWGGALEQIDSRIICLIRETFARYHGLADFAFAMQGLGSGAIVLGGSDAQKQFYLPRVARGELIAAFALSEPDAGSDVAAMSCKATPHGADYVLDGVKSWISNGGIADFYCVFARTEFQPGARGISAFIVDSTAQGLDASERIEVMAPHPMAVLKFKECRLPAEALLGTKGEGFKLAMQVLDIFRASVAAAANGFAARALDEALARSKTRQMFGGVLADLQLTQAALGDMATALDASRLLTYRAAWRRDVYQARTTKEAAMAKMFATEQAQQVIDRAVQLFGGQGVVAGEAVEELYRNIRALRIYEGATEVQKLIIARELLRD